MNDWLQRLNEIQQIVGIETIVAKTKKVPRNTKPFHDILERVAPFTAGLLILAFSRAQGSLKT